MCLKIMLQSQVSLLFLFIFILFSIQIVYLIELKPNCGFPGKPYHAKLNPEKSTYSDGEVVSYECRHYWAAPQTRKCVNGEWEGAEARCGDFVKDVLMKDSQVFDMSQLKPKEMFHYTDMIITNTSWKYPNAFTSNRFKAARLAVFDDHEYLWKFNFSHPARKLYVKVNFNFLNFTIQTEEVQKNHQFFVSVEISSYRTCIFQYQSRNEWRANGNRYDTFFICEAHSHEDSVMEAKSLPNYMNMRTKSSHNITHEFVALFFGTVYGTNEEPLCGDPPLRYGESYRANQEYREYMIDCLDTENWYDATTGSSRRFNYGHKCIGDMMWNGTRPKCRPKKFCPLYGALSHVSASFDFGRNYNENITETSKKNISEQKLVVDSIVNYFHPSDSSEIFATIGTEVTYSCINDDYLLVGKETRKCNANNKWNGHEPICKYIKNNENGSRNILMIIVAIMSFLLFVILIISGILFWTCNKKMKLKMAKAEADKAIINAGAWQSNDFGLYDNIEKNGKIIDDDDVYEIYEHIDEPMGNEYTPYNDSQVLQSNYDSISPHGAMGMSKNVPFVMSETEDDYVRMLKNSTRYEHLLTNNVPFRNESFKRRNAEPSYLEIQR